MNLLEAVNLILPKLGEHRVTQLDQKHPTLAIILPEVDNEIRRMLARGWWFNEFDTILYPSAEGEVVLGSDALTFTPTYTDTAVQRGNKLYNPLTLSFIFPEPVPGRVRQFIEFDDLPESAAQAVYFTALVTCYITDIGMANEVQAWSASASSAYSDLLAEHLRQKRFSTKSTRQWANLRRALRG
jgi:hypothetical protein